MAEKTAADPYLIEFGRNIRALRTRVGLSQEETADKAGIHVTYLSGVERGLRNPSVRNLRRLALALGVTTKDLFGFEESS